MGTFDATKFSIQNHLFNVEKKKVKSSFVEYLTHAIQSARYSVQVEMEEFNSTEEKMDSAVTSDI